MMSEYKLLRNNGPEPIVFNEGGKTYRLAGTKNGEPVPVVERKVEVVVTHENPQGKARKLKVRRREFIVMKDGVKIRPGDVLIESNSVKIPTKMAQLLSNMAGAGAEVIDFLDPKLAPQIEQLQMQLNAVLLEKREVEDRLEVVVAEKDKEILRLRELASTRRAKADAKKTEEPATVSTPTVG